MDMYAIIAVVSIIVFSVLTYYIKELYNLKNKLPESAYFLRTSTKVRLLIFQIVSLGWVCIAASSFKWKISWLFGNKLIVLICLTVISCWVIIVLKKLVSNMENPFWSISSSLKPNFNFFLSYKSEDSDLVRRVGELIVASNKSVWLDQYSIPLYNRETFQQQYLAGIESASVFIVFLHDLYYDGSIYCEEELARICKRIKSNHNCQVITIVTSSQSLGSAADLCLKKIETSRIESNSLEEIIDFIIKNSNMSDNSIIQCQHSFKSPSTFTSIHFETVISIDPSGWVQMSENTSHLQHNPRDFIGPVFQTELNGGKAILQWTLGPDPERKKLDYLFAGSSVDDKELSLEMRNFSEKYMRNNPTNACVGTHAVFIRNSGHLGLTYWCGGKWVRVYSIMVKRPRKGCDEIWEAHLHFSYSGTFKQFCLSAGEFDRIAKSFQWELNTEWGKTR